MKHQDNGIFDIVEIHEDKEYAQFRAKSLGEKYDQYYTVVQHQLIKTPD